MIEVKEYSSVEEFARDNGVEQVTLNGDNAVNMTASTLAVRNIRPAYPDWGDFPGNLGLGCRRVLPAGDSDNYGD